MLTYADVWAADALTIRQRALTAAQRVEVMGWWLLLKEEMARTRGLVGLQGRAARFEHSVTLSQVVDDPFFLDMLHYVC